MAASWSCSPGISSMPLQSITTAPAGGSCWSIDMILPLCMVMLWPYELHSPVRVLYSLQLVSSSGFSSHPDALCCFAKRKLSLASKRELGTASSGARTEYGSIRSGCTSYLYKVAKEVDEAASRVYKGLRKVQCSGHDIQSLPS
jgi:hypothetical protein